MSNEKEKKEITEPLVSLSRDGIHIISDDVARALEKKNLSPSLVNAMDKCHAKWIFSTFVQNEILPPEPDNARTRGSMFHKVMEELFILPPEERTTTATKEMVKKVLTGDEFSYMTQYPEAMVWLKNTINAYYNMGAKPQNVEIAKITNEWGKEKIGLEVWVRGKVGDTKRDILGAIDRLAIDKTRNDGSVIIEDWKTGQTVHNYRHDIKDDEGWDEARQQIIYSMLLQQPTKYRPNGVPVSRARLIFPAAVDKKTKEPTPSIVNVDIHNEELKQKAIAGVENADKCVDDIIQQNAASYAPSFLCAWCPLAKVCPMANIKPYPKMQDAYATQPDPTDLRKGVLFK